MDYETANVVLDILSEINAAFEGVSRNGTTSWGETIVSHYEFERDSYMLGIYDTPQIHEFKRQIVEDEGAD